MRTLLRCGILVSILAVSLSVSARHAHAAGTRYFAASTCQVASGAATFNTSGQVQNSSGTALVLWCPLIIDPQVTLPAGAPTITVDGFSNSANNAVTVKVCSTVASGFGQTCSSMNSGTNSSGVFHLTPFIPGVNSGDYPYVLVTMGGPSGGSFNTFFGYSLSN